MTDYTFKSNFTTKIDFRQAKTPKTNSLTVVYIHGLYSDCWGRKPENVMEWCAANGVNFFRFELAGHGSDSARYEETDVNIWKAQLLEVIDDIVKTDVILAGSSLGGWLSLLAALERPEKVKGVLGLAAAPEFTADLETYIFTPEQKEKLYGEGRLEFVNADFTYVFSVNLGYKNFDLSVYMMGVYGNEVYRNWDSSAYAQFNYRTGHLNRWHGEGTSNWDPILDPSRSVNLEASSYYVEDGSFFRIRNIELGYTFDPRLLNRIKLQSLRIYGNVQNPKTWSRNTGYTPEVGGSATAFGVDGGGYPMPVVYTLGFNLSF